MRNCQQLRETRDLETVWRHSGCTRTHTHAHKHPKDIQTHPHCDAEAITTHRQLLPLTHGRSSETFLPCVDEAVMWFPKH